MAIKNQLKVEMWKENTVSTVVENKIKEEEHKEVKNTPVEEKKSIKKLFKKKK